MSLKLLRSLEPCQTCQEGSHSTKNGQWQIFEGMYLGGLWCCTHGLRVGGAVVCCLLAVVLCPGSAVVWLSSRLRGWGCCSCWSLRCRLTWNVNQKAIITSTLRFTNDCLKLRPCYWHLYQNLKSYQFVLLQPNSYCGFKHLTFGIQVKYKKGNEPSTNNSR